MQQPMWFQVGSESKQLFQNNMHIFARLPAEIKIDIELAPITGFIELPPIIQENHPVDRSQVDDTLAPLKSAVSPPIEQNKNTQHLE